MQKQEGLFQLKNRTYLDYCISSKTEDDNHILIWDFDMIEKYFALRALSQVQHFHGLGDIYLIKSTHGYNAICLDKLWLNKVYNILFYTRWNDFHHVRIGFKSESWALRISDDKKIVFKLIPTEEYDRRMQSSAHYKFFKKIFDFKDFKIVYPDELNDVQLESYKQNKIEVCSL